MGYRESAAAYLRDCVDALAEGPLESDFGTIGRLSEIAADLDVILEAVPKSGEGAIFKAVQRLRGDLS